MHWDAHEKAVPVLVCCVCSRFQIVARRAVPCHVNRKLCKPASLPHSLQLLGRLALETLPMPSKLFMFCSHDLPRGVSHGSVGSDGCSISRSPLQRWRRKWLSWAWRRFGSSGAAPIRFVSSQIADVWIDAFSCRTSEFILARAAAAV